MVSVVIADVTLSNRVVENKHTRVEIYIDNSELYK